MPDAPPVIIEVAVPLPLERTFSYRVPPRLAPQIEVGKRVLVPFGRRRLTAYLLAVHQEPPSGELKEVIDFLDPTPLVTAGELEFLRWVAGYYHHPLGEVIKTALPPGINLASKKGKTGADGEGELSGGRRIKTSLFCRATATPSEANLKGKALAILALLREEGELPAAELRRRFAPCDAPLRRLRELGLVETLEREVYRDPFREEPAVHDAPLPLNEAQQQALAAIETVRISGGFAPFLLHGVTGSGKTEVYLQAIARFLAEGKSALVLVPEISLTPQLVRRFRQRFACGIAVLHSALADGERYDEWRRIRRGEVQIVIGARSAVFAPLARLGIIVVDEEHEASFKQAEGLRYNARDLALVRGQREGAVVLLGSATPLVTTFHAARSGRLGYLSLPRRVRGLPLPAVTVLDQRGRRGESLLPELRAALADTLAKGGQALLFLNRRGFATWVTCADCGHVLRCPNCAVTLTYHQRREIHLCHYCDFALPAPSVCPACAGGALELLGRGTERLAEEVQELFPAARVARMDRDTTSGRGGHARVLRGLEEGKVDILVGTQMIAKGHDFPGVTLVGVVSADATLNLPDFRSAERAFQLLAQVAGRAGRGDAAGQVLVQTLAPDHYAVVHAAGHDYAGFSEEELAFRQETGYPPFSHLAALLISSTAPAQADDAARQAGELLRRLRDELAVRIEVLGPAPAPLSLVRGRHRRQLLLKALSRPALHQLLTRFRASFAPPATVRLAIDVDPVELL